MKNTIKKSNQSTISNKRLSEIVAGSVWSLKVRTCIAPIVYRFYDWIAVPEPFSPMTQHVQKPVSNNHESELSSKNKHVEEFLNYYCDLKSSPEYAVMLKGKWGCGKTWFIKKCLDRYFEGKHLYISLYGIGSYKEIEDLFFQQLHPILSSKGMALTGKILKGALRAGCRFDLDNCKKTSISINTQIPEISIPDSFKNADGNILVFDDIERCCLKIQDILGYINHFVEHQGFKVIIICNEDEILKDEDKKKHYEKIKEKLVGKTFEIQSNVEDVVRTIILKINDKRCKDLITSELELIKNIFIESKHDNLRILKQTIFDFERFFSAIEKRFSGNADFLKHLLKLFLVLSFEIKAGSINSSDLKQFSQSYLDDVFSSKDDSASKSKVIADKYTDVVFHEHLIDFSLWELYFDKGIIDTPAIEESISKSKYFYNEHTENWVKLWNFHDLDDDEFEALYEKVSREFSEKRYTETGVIKHVAGMLLRFADLGLIEKTKNDVLDASKEYVDHLKSQKMLAFKEACLLDPFEKDHWGGLSYMGYDLAEFKQFDEYLSQKIEESIIALMPDLGGSLLKTMIEDTRQFTLKLVHNSIEESIYRDAPILSYIKPEKFVESYIGLPSKDKRAVMRTFIKRYEQDAFLEKIYSEQEWLKKVKSLFVKKQETVQGRLSKYHLGIAINELKKILKKFERFEKSRQKNQEAEAATQ